MNKEEIEIITNYIFLESKPQKVDLAIVFGTRHREPLEKVMKLYKKGFISRILLSGGKNKVTKKNEAKEMSKILIKMGVDRDNLILEDKSANSLENVLFSKRIIKEKIGFKKVKKIAAIVKHYHSRRALMTLKKHFPKETNIIPIAYEVYGFNKNNWHKKNIGREKVLEEWRKIPIYLAKKDIKELCL